MRPRHPAVLLGALVARLIEVQPVDHDAIVYLIATDQEDIEPVQASSQASRGAE